MPTLIACLSTGKGTWLEVIKIIQSQRWDKVYLLTNQFGQENFKADQSTELIVLNSFNETADLVEEIKQQLKNKITDFEVALNLVSGAGKEHMALLEAVLELGLNFRLITVKNNRVEILGINRN